MKKKIAGCLTTLMLVSYIGGISVCAGNDTDVTDLKQNGTEVTDFAVRLFQNGMEEEKNTLISPLSVLYALAMTANGAEGETLSQMETVLGLPTETLNEWLHIYMERLLEDEDYELNLANAIWFKDDPNFEVKEEFLQINEEYYDSKIEEAPFDETTLQAINDWVEESTDGMVKDILNEIPEEAIMYLVNALAFEARWDDTYTEYQVQEGIFTTEDGTEQSVEMMNSVESDYLEDEQAVGFVKYFEDQAYAFAALMPNEGVSIAEYVDGLTGEHIQELLAEPKDVTVYAAIPKFESTYDVEMSEILKDMGMPDAFDWSKADFSRMGTYKDLYICINRVLHKTGITVNEQGTKAGAATVVEMVAEGAMEITEYKEVELNRPFVYMLIDCENKIPFFIGTMMDVNESTEGELLVCGLPPHVHEMAKEPQTVEDPISGYCGNMITTVHLDGKEISFMYGDSVTLTDILINLAYDSMKVCRCMTEFTVDTEMTAGYGVNLTEGFVRCEEGQADLTEEQVATIKEIIGRLREELN